MGADKTKCKTAASIAGIDPYKEKKQIVAKMNANKANNTTKPSEDVTKAPVTEAPAATPATEAPTLPEQVTSTPTEPATSPDITVSAYGEPTTVTVKPIDGNKTNNGSNGKKDSDYNVIDIGSIGTGGGSIVFILILITAIVASGIVVVLTANKKREEEI